MSFFRKPIKDYLKIGSMIILVIFSIMEFTLKPNVWVDYIWMPYLALVLLLASVMIENKQLKYELSNGKNSLF